MSSSWADVFGVMNWNGVYDNGTEDVHCTVSSADQEGPEVYEMLECYDKEGMHLGTVWSAPPFFFKSGQQIEVFENHASWYKVSSGWKVTQPRVETFEEGLVSVSQGLATLIVRYRGNVMNRTNGTCIKF